MNKRIYLDHNATTPIDNRVLEAVIQEMKELGNPSSIHFHGQQCRRRLSEARQTIARFLAVKSHDILFTSGGTEGANLLIQGALQGNYTGHLITSSVEHSCVYQTMKEMENRGCKVSFLPSGLWGAVRPEAILEAITPNTRLIVLMAVNNETGVKTDIEAIAALAQNYSIPFIVDGVAWLGKEKVTIPPGVSAMFFSGHKIHAPKGIGVVYRRQSLKMSPLLLGGSQEFNHRAGTENVPGIVGLSIAISILEAEQGEASRRMQRQRDTLENELIRRLGNIVVNGQGPRVVNTSNLSFLGLDGESLLMNLDLAGVSVSHGSACSSGAIEPSRILLNMGIPLEQARSAIRFSVSRLTTEEEIDQAIEIICNVVTRLRNLKN